LLKLLPVGKRDLSATHAIKVSLSVHLSVCLSVCLCGCATKHTAIFYKCRSCFLVSVTWAFDIYQLVA